MNPYSEHMDQSSLAIFALPSLIVNEVYYFNEHSHDRAHYSHFI